MSDTFAENIHNTTVCICAVVDCDPFSCNDGGYSKASASRPGVDVTFWMLPFMTRYNGDQIIIVLGALLLFCDAPFLEPEQRVADLQARAEKLVLKHVHCGCFLFLHMLV